MTARIPERYVFFGLLALAAGITVLFFAPFLRNFFAYDDFGLLELTVRGPEAILLGYNHTLRFVNNAVWIPLHALSGYDPLGYNLFGMALWFLNGVLLYRFVRTLLGDPLPAAFAGILFTAAAAGSDALFWRAASGTLLNVTFYLLSLHAYTIFRQSGNRKQWYLSVACFILALFSKEEAASLPLVIILLEWLYFNGRTDIRGVARRVLVFCAIIGLSILTNYVVVYRILHAIPELANIFRFRPLHSLLSGWTAFFLSPEGRLAATDPRIYITALLIPLLFFLIRDRRLLILGLGWIFLSFLPQSLSGMTTFSPEDVISVSLSRHLYLPSIGVALVYTAALGHLAERLPGKTAAVAALLFLACYLPYNYHLVAQRGAQWAEVGRQMQLFLTSIRKAVPRFPPNSRIFIVNTPAGRAFVQQALRAFYNDPSITYIPDMATYQRKPDESALLITCHLEPDGTVGMRLDPIEEKGNPMRITETREKGRAE